MSINAPCYLFVYGTLLDERNEFAIYLKANSLFYNRARFKGKLFNVGEYPGAILQPDSEEYVFGNIFILKNAETVLKKLDDYEGFGDDQRHPNEFVRELVKVEAIDNEVINCWVYLYNLPVEGLRQIISGDYFTQ